MVLEGGSIVKTFFVVVYATHSDALAKNYFFLQKYLNTFTYICFSISNIEMLYLFP